MRVPFLSPTIGATTTFDLNQATGARVFLLTVTQITTLAFTNVPAATFAARWLGVFTNGGAFAVTHPASVVWLNGTPTFKDSGVDIVEYFTRDAGTTIYAKLWNGPQAPAPRNNVDAGTGAVTTEVTLATIPVPANQMGKNGILRVSVAFVIAGVANTKTLRIKYGGTTFGAIAYAAGVAGEGVAVVTIINKNAVNVQWSAGFMAVQTGFATTVATVGAVNSAVAQDVVVTGQTVNAGDELTTKSTLVEVLPSY